MTLIVKAQTLALLAHEGQKYGNRPFVEHPRDVARIAEKYGFSNDVIAAAWLHDTLEDCPRVSKLYLAQNFSTAIAELVEAVTDEPGKNRKERAAKTLPKTRKAGSDAVGLKLCDRLSNVQAAVRDKDTLLNMYRKEYPKFKEALYREGEHEELWKKLDELLN
jgi:(p)ppGpp synthase/HD superfamily hydrolase